MMKPILLKVINVGAGIAAVVFWFMPLGTVTQVLLCVGSLAIAFVCYAVSGSLNGENTGYWPNNSEQ
jgi:hypothetical protein